MNKIEEGQKNLYYKKFLDFGDDPKSLSWNDKRTQELRFQKISELFKCEKSAEFSVHEIGCGLAHFKEYLDNYRYNCIYSGSDIIPEFIDYCKEKYPQCYFTVQSISANYDQIDKNIKGKDYYCLSGTFYTKEDNAIREWEQFVFKSIGNMFKMAKKGICFNFLTSYSDFYDTRLYYADPKKVIDWCIKNLSRFISISHDIPLYEFTVIIYKNEFLREKFPEYGKYFKTS